MAMNTVYISIEVKENEVSTANKVEELKNSNDLK